MDSQERPAWLLIMLSGCNPADFIADTNPIRAVDVFVDEFDLGRLRFNDV